MDDEPRFEQFLDDLWAGAESSGEEVLSMTCDGVLLGAAVSGPALAVTVYGSLPPRMRRRLLDRLSPVRLPTYSELRDGLAPDVDLPADPGRAGISGRLYG